MKLGLCAQVLYHLPFEEALATAGELGFEAIELPVDARSPFIDLDEALGGGWRRIRQQVSAAGLQISALSNHQEGQLLSGPHGVDTDGIHSGSVDEKVRYASRRLEQTADLAERLEVGVVCGFTGCEDYSRWFPWPLEDGYERMGPVFRERLLPVLEAFSNHGVRFAHECHPKQFAYNLETAKLGLELIDGHTAFGFNFDPANLLLAAWTRSCSWPNWETASCTCTPRTGSWSRTMRLVRGCWRMVPGTGQAGGFGSAFLGGATSTGSG